MSLLIISTCILVRSAVRIELTGSQRKTEMYRANHALSDPPRPSHTAMPKTIGPRMERTMRMNVRRVSMTSEAAL